MIGKSNESASFRSTTVETYSKDYSNNVYSLAPPSQCVYIVQHSAETQRCYDCLVVPFTTPVPNSCTEEPLAITITYIFFCYWAFLNWSDTIEHREEFGDGERFGFRFSGPRGFARCNAQYPHTIIVQMSNRLHLQGDWFASIFFRRSFSKIIPSRHLKWQNVECLGKERGVLDTHRIVQYSPHYR